MPEPPEDRYCDLVMKGGIASGIVYPRAVALLAGRYRFKSIGGSSVGAVAAALAAAAEYNRRHNGTRAGFALLARLPEELQEKIPGTDRSRLLGLFQPQPGTRRLFRVLIAALNRSGNPSRAAAVLLGLLRAYWPAALASVAMAALTGALMVALPLAQRAAVGAGSVATAGPFAPGGVAVLAVAAVALVCVLLVGLLVTVGAWLYRDIVIGVGGNGFGLCSGLGGGLAGKALTPWLHALIQDAAGLPADGPPLTFGMLWDAPGFPPSWLKPASGSRIRSIDLQVFSTNLGHGRPYIFPPPAGEGPDTAASGVRLYFNRDELARYLPGDVLAWMVSHAGSYRLAPGREGADPGEDEARRLGLHELPEPRDFPVLLAARMSLSFPLLLSAVPLWAIDRDSPRGCRHFRRCWFTDGGVCSNFPIHLFDGLVPLWPTFGINLEPRIKGRGAVFLPRDYRQGYGERWDRFDERRGPAWRFAGFLSAIVSTMQNWNDNARSRMPGFRDRIARVRLAPGEGGLNLNMSEREIESVASKGARAAAELIARFLPCDDSRLQAAGWDEQRFVRLMVLLTTIEAVAPSISNAFDDHTAHVTSFATMIERAAQAVDRYCSDPAPVGFDRPLSAAQAERLREVLAALDAVAHAVRDWAALSEREGNGFEAVPQPQLRVRPPL